MRIACFVSGGAFGLVPLQRLATEHEVALVVRPDAPASLVRRAARAVRRVVKRPPPDPLTEWLTASALPVARVARGDAARLMPLLLRARADLVCIATFPWLLPDSITEATRFGALNLHASLLPRHRGPNPWLWTYHAQDLEAGITVHEAVRRADAGAIHAQAARALPRGEPVVRLHADLAALGAEALADAVRRLETGTARPVAQDDARATRAPRVAPGQALARFADWDVAEVWHFLAGMVPQFIEPLRDPAGRAAVYRTVPAFSRGPAATPGTTEPADGGWLLHCRGGTVRLDP